MSVADFRYKAFISYSHADKAWAEWLLKSLESFRIPRNLVGRKTDFGPIPDRLAPIFRDRDELPAAHRLTDRLFEALRASEFLIVLCSPRSAQSKLVNREIVEFKKTHGDGRVLCLIVDGKPFADNPAEECFPEALLHSFRADGSRGGLSAEGLAADIRADGDGKRMGLLKIVAGLIGVGLNDLVRRDEQRRQRNMIAVATASLIGMSVMGTLTYEASTAREHAKSAEKQAQNRRLEAEAQLKHNQELMHYTMTVMYRRLLEHGNLDTLEEITTRILASFDGTDLSKVPPGQMFHYIGVALRLGQNYDRKGNSAKAREIFENALSMSRQLYAQHPNTEEGLFRLQNNLFFTGYLALRQGRFQEAERDYRERLSLVVCAYTHPDTFTETIGEIPHPRIWTTKLADAKMNLAGLLAGPMGRVEEAIPLHLESIDLFKEVVDLLDRPESKVELASAHHYAAKTFLLAGNLNAAEEHFRKRGQLYGAMLAENPENFRIIRRKLMTKQSLAKVALYRGDLSTAHALYSEAAKGFDQLVNQDPKNTMWLGDSARAYIDLASTALRINDRMLANEALNKGRAQIVEALDRDNSRPRRRLTLYMAMAQQAELAALEQDLDKAQALYQETIAALSSEGEGYLRVHETLSHFARTHLQYGQLLAELNKVDKAQAQWRLVTDALQTTEASLELSAKESMLQAFKLLGQHEPAVAIHRELEGYGYSLESQSAVSTSAAN